MLVQKARALVTMAVVAAVAALAACDGPAGPAGPSGATGLQGPAGAVGPIGPLGVSGNANVTVYEYGPLVSAGIDSFQLEMPNLSTEKRDNSLVLAYAYKQARVLGSGGGGYHAAWFPVPGWVGDSIDVGAGITYQSPTDPNTQIMPVTVWAWNPVTIDKFRIFVVEASTLYSPSPSVARTMDYQSLITRLGLQE
jgi:hypothetical protein